MLEFEIDDGAVFYLNGEEIARRNMGPAGMFIYCDQQAFIHEDYKFHDKINAGPCVDLLEPGTNVLAVQVHSRRAGYDDDLFAEVSLYEEVCLYNGGHEPVDTNLVYCVDGDYASWRYHVGLVEPSGGVYDPSFLENTNVAAFSDWIELHNTGETMVDLSGWFVSDQPDEPTLAVLPTGTVVWASGYLLLLADGLQVSDPSVYHYVHLPFKLSADGEELRLYNQQTQLVTSLTYPQQFADHVYGRTDGTNYFYTPVATPDGANEGCCLAGRLDLPTNTLPSGFYTGTTNLIVYASQTGAVLRYEVDGNEPNEESPVLPGGTFSVTTDTVLRVKAFATNWIASETATWSYFMDEPGARKTVPAVVLSASPECSLYKPYGITAIEGGTGAPPWAPSGPADYNMPMQCGRPYERTGHMALVYPDGTPGHGAAVGMRIAGSAYGRPRYVFTNLYSSPWPNNATEKPSFNLFFRDDYGGALYDYPALGTNRSGGFSSFRLRGGHNDTRPFIRDEFMRRIFLETGQLGSLGMICTLYLNGQYKGYYNLCERIDEKTLQRWYGHEEEWDVRKITSMADGTDVAYVNMLGFMESHDLSVEENYLEVETMLDVENYIDYLLVNIYGATWDWPYNNYIVARERSMESLFRFYVWDAEGTFGYCGHKPLDFDTVGADLLDSETAAGRSEISRMFRQLYEASAFRRVFADHVYGHFFNDGALTSNRLLQVFEPLYNESVDLIGYTDAFFVSNWLPHRADYVLEDLRGHGLWPETLAPRFDVMPGSVPENSEVCIINDNTGGTVYYTLNGTDPCSFDGTPSGCADTNPIPVDTTLTISARVWSGSEWSPLCRGTFVPPETASLQITELMYHPDGEGCEFIEIFNAGSSTAYLDEACFTDGIELTFEAGDEIAPGEYFVVAEDYDDFCAVYTGRVADAEYDDGKLSNGGEHLCLVDAADRILCEITYGDKAPWPVLPDGDGFSLERKPASSDDPNDPANWRASSVLGGTPGEAPDAGEPVPSILINEVLTRTSLPSVDTIELYNPNTNPVGVGGWFLSDDAADLFKYRIPDDTTIPANGFLLIDQAEFHDNNPRTPFRLDAHGEQIILVSADTEELLTGHRHDVLLGASDSGRSFGRYVNSLGAERWPAQDTITLGNGNAGPRVGPLVISEIVAECVQGAGEYLEVQNISDDSVALYDPVHPANTWRVDGVGPYWFPSGVVLSAGHYAVICSMDPAQFRVTNDVPDNVMVFGPMPGNLADAGEKIAIQKPGDPYYDFGLGAIVVPYIDIDAVDYRSVSPWPAGGHGVSLQRLVPTAYGDEPTNWVGAICGGGCGAGAQLSYTQWLGFCFSAGQQQDPAVTDMGADPDGDGFVNALEYAVGSDPLLYQTNLLEPEFCLAEEDGVYRLQLRYYLNRAARCRMHVEFSDAVVAGWYDASGQTSLDVEPAGAGPQVDVFTVRENPVTGPERRFMRWRFENVVP